MPPVFRSYNTQERQSYKEIIFSNTVQSMRSVAACNGTPSDSSLTPPFDSGRFRSVLVDALQAMNIPLADRSNESHFYAILGAPHQIEGEFMPVELARACKALWSDGGIRGRILAQE